MSRIAVALALVLPLWGGDRALEARLLDPILSELRDGALVRAVVTQSATLPRGTLLEARVARSRPVGLGLRRERASLVLEFRECVLPDGTRHPLGAELRSIDNAREEVRRNGEVRGILAADGPQSWVRGLWFRPQAHLFQRSLLGLTGAAGQAWSRLNMGPFGAVGLVAVRMSVFRLPDPEIRIPAGADLLLEIETGPTPALDGSRGSDETELSGNLRQWIKEQPARVTEPDGKPASDVINLAFLGDEHTVKWSFAAAGWSEADALNRQTFARAYKAFLQVHAYPTAPVSPLHYGGRPPDMVFQRSLNTVAKRHHVRIWRAGEVDGQTVWLGAATHDVGIVFNRGKFTLTHRIDSAIDKERDKLIGDLDFAGCAEPVAFVDRPLAESRAKQRISTDGRVAVVTLRPCDPPNLDVSPSQVARRPAHVRAARRFTLETRAYLLRGNLYYWGYSYARRVF